MEEKRKAGGVGRGLALIYLFNAAAILVVTETLGWSWPVRMGLALGWPLLAWLPIVDVLVR